MSTYNLSRLAHNKKRRMRKKYDTLAWGNAKTNLKVFKKCYRTKKDRNAVEIAKKLLYQPYYAASGTGETIKVKHSLWEKVEDRIEYGWDTADIWEMKGFLSAIRKALRDNFALEEWYIFEVPYGDKEGIIVYFVNKEDYDNVHWHKRDTDIRSLCFDCPYDKLYAQPMKEVSDEKGTTLVEVKTCQEAIFVSE